MELSDVQKEAIAVEVKEAAKHIVKALVLAGKAAVANSENKIDDMVEPVLSPMAEQALLDVIGKLKL